MTEPDLSAGWRPIGDYRADRPTDQQPAPAADTNKPLTKAQKILIGFVTGGITIIAGIGFAGSYTAVTHLAIQKHFGWFSYAFPIGIDVGILAFLALDLTLTWRRIPFPLIRHVAWGLTAATIAFNATAAWGDWTAVGMHAVIPFLFVTAVEAGRHAIGRLADITADAHYENPPLIRWLLSPIPTYRIWRRMRLWHLRSYTQVIAMERDTKVFRARLRNRGRGRFGFRWRSKAEDHELLALRLARLGTPVRETIAAHTAELVRVDKAELVPVLAVEPGEPANLPGANRIAIEAVHEPANPSGSEPAADEVHEPNPESEQVHEPETPAVNPEPEPANRPKRTSGTANLGDRAAKRTGQVQQVLNLIDELGYNTVTLAVVQNQTGMTKTTAHHRLKEARELWNQRAA